MKRLIPLVLWASFAAGQQPAANSGAQVQPSKLRISQGVAERNLIQRVEPILPGDMNLQGEPVVVLAATINKQGKIERLKALKGHPMLVSAAIDAVRQWTYKPFLLNGEPITVETTVTVSFHR